MSWSLGLIAFALGFRTVSLWREGAQHALEYYTGYLIELSLSVDNLFVFILIFNYFGVPAEAQPKVLKWGILGAIVMRFIMIALGALLLARFDWIIYVFGGILVITGVRMLTQKDQRIDPTRIRSSDSPGECFPSPTATTAPTSSAGPAGVADWPPRSCWCFWSSSGPIWCSPSTASPRSSRSPATRSWSTAPTCSPFSASGRCSSCWRA